MAITCDRNKQFNRRELRSPKNRINLKQKKKKKSAILNPFKILFVRFSFKKIKKQRLRINIFI